MTGLLFHEVPEGAASLEIRLREALTRMPDGSGSDLLGRLVIEPHEVPILAVTGAYSTGKSTLIAALTDGHARVTIGADVTTDAVTAYDWDGVVTLLDTPGMHAGYDDHDLLAEEALSRADLVLFTVTVDLFDDDSTRQVRIVADALGKRDQLLVVITKMNTMRAAEGIRRSAVATALAGGPIPPSIECDAGDYLEALSETDEQRRDVLMQHAGVGGLKDAINELARTRGELARYRQPFQLIKVLASEALGRLAADPVEQATLTVLARQQRSLVSHATRIDSAVKSCQVTFRAQSEEAASLFADAVEAMDDETDPEARQAAIAAVTEQLQADLDSASAALGRGLEQAVKRLLDDLGVEVEEITAGEHARYIERVAGAVLDPTSRVRGNFSDVAQQGPTGAPTIPGWLSDAQKWIGQFQRFWGAGGGMSQSAGSTGHRVVLEVGHLFGAKFRPWGAVRFANRVGNAAKVASVAIPVALAVTGTVLEERARIAAERARQQRRNRLLGEIARQANEIADEAERSVRAVVDPQFDAAHARIEAVRAEILSTQAHRSDVEDELQAIGVACQGYLAQLSLPGA